MSKPITPARLAKIKNVHAYVAEHPGCTLQGIAVALGLGDRAVQKYIWLLRDGGHLDRIDGDRFLRGSMPSTYMVTAKPMPDSIPVKRKSERLPFRAADTMIKRRFVPAVQVGMCRDALVAALFGAGPAMHA